ncbi:MAG: class I SAM-dependent methyltransferase family protein [Halobacteriales archaeon]|nr:class I SAM-dependent methyltransferase family protein [Halobacteriales archaeon]
MESPCVRVPREEGEETRQRLADEGVLNRDLRIEGEDGYLYIPVTDAPGEAVFETEKRDFEERETETDASDILGYEPRFETVGDVALLEPEEDEEAGDALVEADNGIVTALRVESPVEGEERTRRMSYVAGERKTTTVHREYGREFVVDLTNVYFTPRLAEERERVASQVREDETVFDMFAGVGPFTVAGAEREARVVASDINERAVELLRENAERNKVAERVEAYNEDARVVAERVAEDGGADRVYMNLPHTADEFLDSTMGALSDEGGVVHYYDIRHEDDLFEGAVEEIREAAGEAGYGVEVLERVVVRSYAPYDYNICVDVRLS